MGGLTKRPEPRSLLCHPGLRALKAARSDPAAHNQMAAVAAALQCMMSPDVALPLDVFIDC